ncbi:MAG TPA: GatB/YqeY domain-containing protein, partial [Allosphingosinicella sp.]|nr:GatB/YqeY domain-containing protein [Allosphingosinicella sp.]
SEEEAKAAIDTVVAETGAASVKDMGRVMALVKERLAGQVDMAKASALVKARLS